MIWLVLRVAAGLALLLAAAATAAFLVDSDGGVQIDLLGRAYPRLTLVEALLVLALLGAAAWSVWRVASFLLDATRFLLGDDAALGRRRARSRARRGHEALAAAHVALGEGDAAAADAHAKRAHRLLGERPLPLLLEADVAEALGDDARAEEAYRALARERETAALGLRRLLALARRRGDADRALKLARHGAKLRPRDVEARRTLIALLAGCGEWSAAAGEAADLRDKRLMAPEAAARLLAGLDLERARAADAAGDRAEAARLADAAAKAAPDFAPAVGFAALKQADGGETMRASRALRDAWRAEPRPELVDAFFAIAPDETASARRTRFAELLRGAPDHPLTTLIAAELALLDGDPSGARAALADIAAPPRTRRAAILRHALACAEGASETERRARLADAFEAPEEPGWRCEACGAPMAIWRLICDECDALGSLAWDGRSPPRRPLDESTRALILGERRRATEAPLRAAAGA